MISIVDSMMLYFLIGIEATGMFDCLILLGDVYDGGGRRGR